MAALHPTGTAKAKDTISDEIMLDHVTSEVKLLDKLMEGKFLTPADRSWVLAQLEQTGQSRSGLVSVLHLTQDRIKNFVDALLFLSKDTAMPLLPLMRFVPQRRISSFVPAAYLACLGVLPFDRLEEDLLVAVMNPYDRKIHENVQALSGRRCTFFLVSPLDYDSAIRVIGQDQG